MKKKLKIAITGGIASGKSFFSKFLISHGEQVIDLDTISHDLTSNDKQTKELIRKKFGDEVFDQSESIDRKKLSNVVFDNFQYKKCLEDILHPRIRKKMNQLINLSKKERVFVEFQLLAEKNMAEAFDHIIIVSSSREAQIERLINKRFMNRKLIDQIIDSQLSDQERKDRLKGFSMDVLENNSSQDIFQENIESLYKKLVNQ